VKRLRYRETAEEDLDRILTEGRVRWGADDADAYVRSIHAELLGLLAHPGIGSERDFILPGLRKWTVKAHHAYYQIDELGIDVVRILHPAMDVGAAISELD
jgi:toxin ParE1/3/4